MRVCTFYETRLGRNDGPPLYWTNAMKNKGWEVVHLSSQHPPPDEHFDLYLWVDWGEDALTEMLPYTPINVHNLHPSVYVTSDTHLGFDYRLNKAREFDFVFCNQERAVEEFKEQGVESVWLPHAVEPQAYPNQPSCSWRVCGFHMQSNHKPTLTNLLAPKNMMLDLLGLSLSRKGHESCMTYSRLFLISILELLCLRSVRRYIDSLG